MYWQVVHGPVTGFRARGSSPYERLGHLVKLRWLEQGGGPASCAGNRQRVPHAIAKLHKFILTVVPERMSAN
jgi:hypothetical protein